jgi:hypothetical protein
MKNKRLSLIVAAPLGGGFAHQRQIQKEFVIRRNILIVDDNPGLRAVLSETWSWEGLHAQDGEEDPQTRKLKLKRINLL